MASVSSAREGCERGMTLCACNHVYTPPSSRNRPSLSVASTSHNDDRLCIPTIDLAPERHATLSSQCFFNATSTNSCVLYSFVTFPHERAHTARLMANLNRRNILLFSLACPQGERWVLCLHGRSQDAEVRHFICYCPCSTSYRLDNRAMRARLVFLSCEILVRS